MSTAPATPSPTLERFLTEPIKDAHFEYRGSGKVLSHVSFNNDTEMSNAILTAWFSNIRIAAIDGSYIKSLHDNPPSKIPVILATPNDKTLGQRLMSALSIGQFSKDHVSFMTKENDFFFQIETGMNHILEETIRFLRQRVVGIWFTILTPDEFRKDALTLRLRMCYAETTVCFGCGCDINGFDTIVFCQSCHTTPYCSVKCKVEARRKHKPACLQWNGRRKLDIQNGLKWRSGEHRV